MLESLAVVIPVRLGSSRIRHKALLPFGNMNLLEWKIRQILEIMPPNNVFVSTESKQLALIAKKCGVRVHHRERYLAIGHRASFSEVIVGIVRDIEFAHIAWVTAVVPLMKPREYQEAFRIYAKCVAGERRYDSLFSANLLKESFWDSHKPLNYQANRHHTISQELPDIFRVTNGLYMRDRESILKEGYFLGKNPYRFCVSKLAGIDIDEYEDYEMARALLSLYHG